MDIQPTNKAHQAPHGSNNSFMLELDPVITARADSRMQSSVVATLWNRFFLGDGVLNLEAGEENTFRLGEAALPTVPEGKEYAISVDEKGVSIAGSDFSGLLRGFFVFLMTVEYDGEAFHAPMGCRESGYTIRNRMLHLCVFPENDLAFMKKVIRYAALCQYTHVVIEFWGMLQFDCLKELAWPQAFTKAQAKELIGLCRELGMEPIPMFNQLGHAAGARWCYGKHVVLDQNPKLQYLFRGDGWVWNISSPQVRQLMKQVRLELYDLFGPGSYIHVGCDEANFAGQTLDLATYLKLLTDEVAEEGRRPMLWMDMLLPRDTFGKTSGQRYTATCDPQLAESIRAALHPQTVLVDWQYSVKAAPVESLLSLKDDPRDVMGAPFFDNNNCKAMAQTIAENDLFGIMMTTWHLLQRRMPSVFHCAKVCGAEFAGKTAGGLFRKINFEGDSYETYGWSPTQLPLE